LKIKKQGTSAQWSFIGAQAHSVTDSSGMGLFDSGTHTLVSFYAFQFVAAGTYSYKDALHPSHTGKVAVPVVVKLIPGPPDSARVTWASSVATGSYVYDVQVEQPGGSTFADWKTSQTGTNAVFGPGDPLYAGPGTYRFQARLRNMSNGKASGFSAAKSIILN
jgi:hypothetical protein